MLVETQIGGYEADRLCKKYLWKKRIFLKILLKKRQ